jgi:hypothetical protein
MTVYDQRCEPAPAAVAHPAHRTPTSTDTIAVDIDVAIGDDSIRFLAYPYEPASVFPTGLVVAADVRDADPTSAPPEVRRTTGETLFVPAPASPALRRFCERNRIPLRRRPDLWDALLEPFLDTEFTPQRQRATTALLARFGLSTQDVDRIRGRFAPAMRAYNSVAWDWCHLGLADLLDALQGHLAGGAHKLEPFELAETYAWAMALADRSGHQAAPLD